MDKEKLQQGLNEYEAKVAKATAKFPERKNFEAQRLYTPLDIEDFDYGEKLGFPGQYPFTRGVQPTMYRGRLWTMRAYAGFATAEETNARYKYLLEAGQTGLSVAMDLPTQIGLDSDHELSHGEVGKVGVAIDSLADMEALFDGIPLDKVSTSMTINGPAAVLLAMYVAVAEKQGVKPENLKGTIQNDILKEYIARGTYIFPPRPSMRLITDTFEYCSKIFPNGIQSASVLTTSARPVLPKCRKLLLRLPMPWRILMRLLKQGKRLMILRPASAGFLQQGLISSAKLPNSARRAACGHVL